MVNPILKNWVSKMTSNIIEFPKPKVLSELDAQFVEIEKQSDMIEEQRKRIEQMLVEFEDD
tara:strand:+ start:1037 stop:1219 length:183 start_codon:yes stop_codon:yes gene_type:complete